MHMTTCDRCRNPMDSWIMSYFNTDHICSECEKKERNHPMYGVAKSIESTAVKYGNLKYPGIGLPEDLKNINI